MKPKLTAIALLSLFFSIHLFAQKKRKGDAINNRVTCVYGDVKPEDFAPTAYAVDSSAEAVYLYDGGYSKFQGNVHGFFDVVLTVHERIRLMKKSTFEDLAKVEIHLYTGGTTEDEQKMTDLQAATYNIENGAVTVTKLDKGSLFKEKSSNYTTTKFTFPNLKEGSIIEYTYTINNPGLHLPSWNFQGSYPRLWSDYEIVVPEFYDYMLFQKGFVPYEIDTVRVSHDNYNIIGDGNSATSASSHITASANTIDHVWAMKNVPALKKESYITTLDDYKSALDFQLSAIRYPDMPVKMIRRTWPDVCDELMKDEDFGAELTKPNNFFNDDVKAATGSATGEEKAKLIYEYVRDNYNCTDYSSRWLSQPLRKTYQTKKGNVADLNLLLTAIYLNEGWQANPVLLSTTDHGKAYELYPAMEKFNYAICRLMLGDKTYLLDAADNKLGFNRLDPECNNGFARIIDPALPVLINLSADSVKESSITTAFLTNENDHSIAATITSTKGYAESLSLRNRIAKSGKTEFFKTISTVFPDNVKCSNQSIDSLKLLDMPVKVSYDLKIENGGEDLYYFNPMLGEQEKDNPFSAAERYYPVDMPYCMDDTYVLNMEVPAGYEVDELPKSARVKLNEDEGIFEYIIAKSGDRIQLRARVKLNKATYEPDDYQTLRDFFAFIVKKEEEQIVFKKK